MEQSYKNAVAASAFMERKRSFQSLATAIDHSGPRIQQSASNRRHRRGDTGHQDRARRVHEGTTLLHSVLRDGSQRPLHHQELESKEEVALQTQNNFKTLAENVRLFSAVLEQSLQRAGAQLTSELTATRARLSELNERLDAYVYCCVSASFLAYTIPSQCLL